MRAMRFHQYGPADVLQLETVDMPVAGPGEVLIRVIASGVNPLDWKIRAGYMAAVMPRELPLIPGLECAGVVEAVGAGVSGLSVGDEVHAMVDGRHGGSYAEYVVVAADLVAAKPRSLDFTQAAALPVTALAAWSALKAGELQAGQRVLIHGGAGGVGSLAVQMARALGATVYATASGADIELVRGYGAEQVIDYKTQRFEQLLSGLDMVLDTLGGPTQKASLGVLRAGGALVALTQPPAEADVRAAGVRGLFVSTRPSGAVLAEIAALLDEGKLKPPACHAYPLQDAARVHQLGEQGQLRGRTVLTVAA